MRLNKSEYGQFLFSSVYSEPVAVMLLRFDNLVQWWPGCKDVTTTYSDQVTHLGCAVLTKVLHLSERVSYMYNMYFSNT